MKKYLLIIGLFLSLAAQAQVRYRLDVNNLSYECLRSIVSRTESHVMLTVFYSDGSQQVIYDQQLRENLPNAASNLTLGPFTLTNKRPTGILTSGFANFVGGERYDAKYDTNSPIGLCNSGSYTIISNSTAMTSLTYTAKVTPILTLTSVDVNGFANTFLPTDDQINLKAETGFPSSVYNWQYSDNGTNWYDFPIALNSQGNASVNVSLKDLYGNTYTSFLGGNTYFRIKTCSADYTNIITLNNVNSAPHINIITAIANTCFGETNGGFKINFDRDLLSGESLNLVITESTTGDVQNVTNITSLESGYAVRTPLIFQPGQYKIEIIDRYNGVTGYSDAPNQSGSASFTGPTAVDFNTTKRNIYCYNGKDGTITINASGGNGGFKVLYKKQQDASYTELPFSTAAQHVLTGLDVGTYNIKVVDQNGCYKKDGAGDEVIATLTIAQPQEALKIDHLQLTNPTAFGATDGKVEAIILGGTSNAGAYNVQWRDINGNVLNNFTNTSNPFKTVLNNVPDGKYILKVTDLNYDLAKSENAAGCIVIDTFTLKQPDVLAVETEGYNSIICNDESNGALYAKASGGIAIPGRRYAYQWFKETNGSFTALTQADSILTGLGRGIYKVKVTDNNNISKESVPFTLTEPMALNFSVSKKDVYCYNGKDGMITVSASGANGDYKLLYKKQEDAGYTTLAFAAGNQHQLNHLDIGTYIIRVADKNGCYQRDANGAEVIQTVTITQPAGGLRVDARNIVNPTAFGATDGRAEISISGGTPVNGSYTVQWTDINGKPLSNFSNTTNPFKTTLNNMPDGKYILRVTDGNFAAAQAANAAGCILLDTIILQQPPPLKVDVEEFKYVSCKGDADGKLYAKATGGIIIPGVKYSYAWFKQQDGTYITLAQTDSILLNANAGIYKVSITDKNNISKESVPFTLTEPPALAIMVSSTPLNCSGDTNGTAAVAIMGGTQPYKIEWSSGDTTANVRNLTDGNYLVFVTDAHGCQVQAQVNVAAPDPLLISSGVVKNPTCWGSTDGAISHTISGGIAPYQFRWSNGATSQNLNNLEAGIYTLIVSESNGCSKSISYNLIQPAAVKLNLGPDISLCTGQVHEADATIQNGAVYKWTGSNGFSANTAKVKLNTAGVYVAEAFTDKGCAGRDTIEIKTSNAVISSEFVVATQAFSNETVNLVNISNPKPQQVAWLIPDDQHIKVIARTDDNLQLVFTAAGSYTISLKAMVGDCFKIFGKQITVMEGTSFNTAAATKEPFIKSFVIAPNPGNGNFYAKVELQEVSKIKLRLLNTITGQLIDSREENGSSSYNLAYYLTLSPGVYVMVLETAKANMVHKVLIQ